MGTTFQFDEEQVGKEAVRLDEAAATLRKLSQDLEYAMTGVSQSWQGEQSTAYRRKGEALREEMDASAKQVQILAEMVREAVTGVKRMEAQNQQIAGTR